MTGNVCPTCSAPIDPALAPVARIRGTKVVTYCSTECANGRPRAVNPVPVPVNDKEPARKPQPEPEPAPARAATERPARGKQRRKVIALSAAIMAGGMIITIINAVSPSTPSDVSAASTRDARPAPAAGEASQGMSQTAAQAAPATAGEAAPAEPAGSAELDPQALAAHAQEVLRELMGSSSTQVRRIAAIALSRTGDAGALELLGTLLGDEASELRQIDVAYALARAGDERGRKLLYERLLDERRDVRLDAARSLVQLGDSAGAKVLERMLSLSNHQIAAAALLARLGNEEGLEELRDALSSSRSSDETRMRAAVALGRAGDASVQARLVEILEDRRYQVGAAEALAALGDPVAVPALVAQLALPSLRVRAALALRRMDVTVDQALLRPLAISLDSGGDDPGRVSAAEAILILTGPKKVAELE